MPLVGGRYMLRDRNYKSCRATDKGDNKEEEVVDESSQPVDRDKPLKNVSMDPALVESITMAVINAIEKLEKEKSYSVQSAMDLGAEIFTNTMDPEVAGIWIERLERCFGMMECPDERKLAIATFLLEGRAYDWWKLTRRLHPNPNSISWADFKAMFNKRFYPDSYKGAKRQEFLTLEQGSMTVAEYQYKYFELSKYATDVIVDELGECRQFVYGLKPEIRYYVVSTEWKEFNKLVDAALRVEYSIYEGQSQNEKCVLTNEAEPENSSGNNQCGKNRKRFWPNVSSRGNFKSKSHGFQISRFHENNMQQIIDSEPQIEEIYQRQDVQIQVEASNCTELPCQTCGKLHRGKCVKGIKLCYNCGEATHLKRDCPWNG